MSSQGREIPRQANCPGLAGWTQGSHKGPDKRTKESQRGDEAVQCRPVSDVAGSQSVTVPGTGADRPVSSLPSWEGRRG